MPQLEFEGGNMQSVNITDGEQPAQVVYGAAWKGEQVAPGNIDALQDRVDSGQFFFHVGNLRPEWSDSKSHDKGKVTSAAAHHVESLSFIGFDKDAAPHKGLPALAVGQQHPKLLAV